jgi:hypothetical protein
MTMLASGYRRQFLAEKRSRVKLRRAEHLRGKRTHLALRASQMKRGETGIVSRKKMLLLPVEIALQTRSN